MQGALSAYRETLAGALEIHLFNRDIDDTNQRVMEKSVAMNTADVGKDLPGVEQLQRKQEAMERDMTAIEGKLNVRDDAWLSILIISFLLAVYTSKNKYSCIFSLRNIEKKQESFRSSILTKLAR